MIFSFTDLHLELVGRILSEHDAYRFHSLLEQAERIRKPAVRICRDTIYHTHANLCGRLRLDRSDALADLASDTQKPPYERIGLLPLRRKRETGTSALAKSCADPLFERCDVI